MPGKPCGRGAAPIAKLGWVLCRLRRRDALEATDWMGIVMLELGCGVEWGIRILRCFCIGMFGLPNCHCLYLHFHPGLHWTSEIVGLWSGKCVKHCETTCTGNISNMKSICLSGLYKSNQTSLWFWNSPFSCKAGNFQVKRQNMVKTRVWCLTQSFSASRYEMCFKKLILTQFSSTLYYSIRVFPFFLRSISFQIVKPPRPRSPSALNRGLSCPPQQWP